jgi:hypothetical protein
VDSACSHPRRNRCADEGIFRLPTPSHLPPPAPIRLIKAALESVLKAVWSHDRSLRTSHVPSTLSHSPLARRRLPTSAGERERSRRTRTVDSSLFFHAFPHTSCAEISLNPPGSPSVSRDTLPLFPSPLRLLHSNRSPHPTIVASRSDRDSTARPAWPRAYPAVASRTGRCTAFRTALELRTAPFTYHQRESARCDLLHTLKFFALSI